MPDFVAVIKKSKALFLKGSPSSIYIFAGLLEEQEERGLSFRVVFTTGETLFAYQRRKIEKAFNCAISDSYGHMERTVAVCQCPSGGYHMNTDYGILEIEKDEGCSTASHVAGSVIGTSMYNFAMPLIRYKVGDKIEMPIERTRCECGRTLPVCGKIIGRTQDVIITPDGRMISNIFILFDILEGALWAQMIQDDVNELRIRIVKGDNFSALSERNFMRQVQELIGSRMRIVTEYPYREELSELTDKKYRPVISNIRVMAQC